MSTTPPDPPMLIDSFGAADPTAQLNQRLAPDPDALACTRCAHVGLPQYRSAQRGSGAGVLVALGIGFLLFVPFLGLALLLAAGLLWLLGAPAPSVAACSACSSTDVVPLNTPQGRRIANT